MLASAKPQTERSRGQVGRHDNDRIGERRNDQMMREGEISGRADPTRVRPSESLQPAAATRASKNSRGGATSCPHAGKLRPAARL